MEIFGQNWKRAYGNFHRVSYKPYCVYLGKSLLPDEDWGREARGGLWLWMRPLHAEFGEGGRVLQGQSIGWHTSSRTAPLCFSDKKLNPFLLFLMLLKTPTEVFWPNSPSFDKAFWQMKLRQQRRRMNIQLLLTTFDTCYPLNYSQTVGGSFVHV